MLIIAEGAYSMDGDVGDIPGLVAVKKKYGCFLMVDEAHSSCVLGPTGGGVDEYFDLQPGDVDIHMGTLSKGLGACGGYLAGSQAIIDYLRYMPRPSARRSSCCIRSRRSWRSCTTTSTSSAMRRRSAG